MILFHRSAICQPSLVTSMASLVAERQIDLFSFPLIKNVIARYLYEDQMLNSRTLTSDLRSTCHKMEIITYVWEWNVVPEVLLILLTATNQQPPKILPTLDSHRSHTLVENFSLKADLPRAASYSKSSMSDSKQKIEPESDIVICIRHKSYACFHVII